MSSIGTKRQLTAAKHVSDVRSRSNSPSAVSIINQNNKRKNKNLDDNLNKKTKKQNNNNDEILEKNFMKCMDEINNKYNKFINLPWLEIC